MDKKFYTDLNFFQKNGITQEYLANILSMSQPNLNAMLNGCRINSKQPSPFSLKLIFQKQTNGIKYNNNKSDFAILFVMLFVYNHNSATERINHRQYLFHSRSATVLEVNDGG